MVNSQKITPIITNRQTFQKNTSEGKKYLTTTPGFSPFQYNQKLLSSIPHFSSRSHERDRMQTMRAEGPPVPCVKCPGCQTYVPIANNSSNTVTTVTTTVRAIERSSYPNEIRITNSRPTVPDFPNVEVITPVATISGPPLNSTGYYRKPTIPFVNPPVNNRSLNVSQYEASWRSKFPRLPIFILSISQFIFTVLIFILEIASLATWNYQPTAVGIWCAIPFLIACISMFLLGKYFVSHTRKKKDFQ